ncbi:MAG: hypothetical protein ACLP50_18000 [Solirubrobacteraceae bacterium]
MERRRAQIESAACRWRRPGAGGSRTAALGRLGGWATRARTWGFAAGHGVDELGELVCERVAVDRWVDEDVGEVVGVGVLDEHGPVAVSPVRRRVWELLVVDREVKQQIALELAVEPQRAIMSATVQLQIRPQSDGVQRAEQRRPGDRLARVSRAAHHRHDLRDRRRISRETKTLVTS